MRSIIGSCSGFGLEMAGTLAMPTQAIQEELRNRGLHNRSSEGQSGRNPCRRAVNKGAI
jgi:hypothetical protein